MVGTVACAIGEAPISVTTTTSNGGTGGGEDLGPCGIDCSKIETPQCTIAVCNTGQEVGPLNTCIVIPAPNGTTCDDGKYCTVGDACDNGACVGSGENHCGIAPNPCMSVICYEETKSCDVTPVNEGTECTPTELCQVNGVCHIGDCIGEPKDCTFSPLGECNKVACDPGTGKCVGTPDPDKNDAPCTLTGDLCTVHRTCNDGQCGGGEPKDCSALNVGCQVGICDNDTGFCGAAPAPIGTACAEGIPECQVGACDVKGKCIPAEAPDGVSCNDHNACTKADTCGGGICSGSSVAGCTLYLNEGFETCPSGWTFGGDWECGKPTNVGPPAAHTGVNVIGTKIAGLYSVNQSFTTTVANSPPINLTAATKPMVSFWTWYHTEGGTFDGWNVKVSTNGGQTFTEVMTVSPAYNLSIAGQPSYGGDHSGEGWQSYIADLSAYAGQTVILQFGFRSDGATVFPGVYIDDVVVAEPAQLPLFITSTSPLQDVYVGKDYAVQLTRTGGSPAAVWSIVGGTNYLGWLDIDGPTGVLKGPPPASAVGPVSVTVRVQEPMLTSNFAEKTFAFNVIPDTYYTSFELCPSDWVLTGDWQCGVPLSVGPATAYVGTKCLATQIAGEYHDLQTFTGATATSPDIDSHQRVGPDDHDVPDVGRHRGRHLRRLQPEGEHRRDELHDRQHRHAGVPAPDQQHHPRLGRPPVRARVAAREGRSLGLRRPGRPPALRLPERLVEPLPRRLHRRHLHPLRSSL
ncbi:MAG: immune inhibitor A [Minicystis sp.]